MFLSLIVYSGGWGGGGGGSLRMDVLSISRNLPLGCVVPTLFS